MSQYIIHSSSFCYFSKNDLGGGTIHNAIQYNSIQIKAVAQSLRKRGKSMPSRISKLHHRRNKTSSSNGEVIHHLEQTWSMDDGEDDDDCWEGEDSNQSNNSSHERRRRRKSSSQHGRRRRGSSWLNRKRRSLSEEEDDDDNESLEERKHNRNHLQEQQRRTASKERSKSSALLSTIYKSDRIRSKSNKSRDDDNDERREKNTKSGVVRRSRSGGRLVGQGFASKNGIPIKKRSSDNDRRSSSRGGGGQQRSTTNYNDHQSALNDHCRKHFKVPNNKKKQQHHHKHRQSSQSRKKQLEPESYEEIKKERSKSMPPLNNTNNPVQYLDTNDVQTIVSPVASVDSSWRYKRLKQKYRNKEKMYEQRRREEEERRRQQMYRSKSCEPSVGGGAEIVPYERREADGNKYVNYNLGQEILLGHGDYGTPTNRERKKKEEEEEEEEKETNETPKQPSPVLRLASVDNSDKEDYTLGTNFRTEGSGTWYGRAPDPVNSLNGSFTMLSPGLTPGRGDTYDDDPNNGRVPDPPETDGTFTSDCKKDDPPPMAWAKKSANKRTPLPDSDNSKSEKSSSDTSGSSSSRDTPTKDVENDDDDDDDGSLLESQPSTLGANEFKKSDHKKKLPPIAVAPPLHSDIRLKKPSATPSTGSISSRKSSSSKRKEKRKNKEVKDNKERGSFRTPREDTVKDFVTEIKVKPMTSSPGGSVDSIQSPVSEITMPLALRKAPPMHSRIRAKKPVHRSKDHLAVYRESKLPDSGYANNVDNDVPTVSKGPLTGNEIEVQSNTGTKDVSEITMPIALSPPFAQALRSYSKQKQQSKAQQKLSSEKAHAQKLQKAQEQIQQAQAQIKAKRQQQQQSQNQYQPPPDQSMMEQQQNSTVPYPPPPPRHRPIPAPPPPPRTNSSGNMKLLGRMTAEDKSHTSLSVEERSTRHLHSGRTTHRVENMPYTDSYQNMGLYSGETNDYGQPCGQGAMYYDNGMFFEGLWSNGTPHKYE